MASSFPLILRRVAQFLFLTIVTAGLGATSALCQTPIPVPAPDGETIWRIYSPDVKQARVQYPTVRFNKGDKVIVTGGGCVQTGGHGRTWKRYINPFGNNSDRLYHGRIWIPGATAGLRSLRSLVGPS